jgi:hypothetical protein
MPVSIKALFAFQTVRGIKRNGEPQTESSSVRHGRDKTSRIIGLSALQAPGLMLNILNLIDEAKCF